MLIRDSKIPTMEHPTELIDPNTKRMIYDPVEMRKALVEDTPVVINDKPYYLGYKVKEWVSKACFYNDDLVADIMEEEYWRHNMHHYWEKPVTLREFINNPEFLGEIYGERMNKWWMGVLDVIHPRLFQKKYCEVIASLAIGCGKTTASAISLSYEMYKLMCLKEPTNFYKNLVKGTKIVFSIFNVSRQLAYDVTFDPFRTIFSESPYFKERVTIPGKSSLTEYGIYITEDIRCDLGSLDRNALGKAVFGAVLDEGNFGRVENQVLDAYSALRTRIASRFGTVYGFPGILWCVSSPITDADSVNTLINKADPNMVFVLDNVAQWEVWADPNRYALNKRFPVFKGDANNDPRIILNGEEGCKKYSPGSILYVPYNLYPLFKHDLYKNLRDLGGVRVAGASNLFRSVEVIRNSFTGPTMLSTNEPIHLDFYDSKNELKDIVNTDYFKNPIYPDCPRYIHLDEASAEGVNRFGIAATFCKYIEKQIEPAHITKDIFEEDTAEISHVERFYHVDWCMVIEAKHNQKIPLRKIREFLVYLRELGYPIELITGDHVSQSTRNDLEIDGFKCEYLSVDKGTNGREPWISFRGEVEGSNIICPRYPIAILEAQHLIDNGTKIDHPAKFQDQSPGSKDCMDAIVGSYWACKTAKRSGGIITIDKGEYDNIAFQKKLRQIRNSIAPQAKQLDPEVFVNFIKA